LFNNKVIIIVASLIIAAGLIIHGLSNRFYIDTSTQLKVDRLTGKTYELSSDGWVEIENKKDITESNSTGLNNYENLDKSIVKCVLNLSELSAWEKILEERKKAADSKGGILVISKDINKYTVIINNISQDYIVKFIELDIRFYKDDVLFYKEITKEESLNITPLSSFSTDFNMDSSVTYPDKPWSYSIDTVAVKGLPIE